jgi:hypothetical protein
MTAEQRDRLLGDLVRAGDHAIATFTRIMAAGPEHAGPADDFDTIDAVDEWNRLVDDARREGLVPA